MALPKDVTWTLDDHTVAKHEILRRYLQAWFPILGSHHDRIVYIDGFCGPGRYQGGQAGSPVVALEVAMTQRAQPNGGILFWFMDADAEIIDHLKSELSTLSIPSRFKVKAEGGTFDAILTRALNQLDAQKLELAPTFAFIDPFGFSGAPLALISRLLARKRCEVLINFQVEAVNRWIEHPDPKVVAHLARLFGTDEFEEIVKTSSNRIADLRDLYQSHRRSGSRP